MKSLGRITPVLTRIPHKRTPFTFSSLWKKGVEANNLFAETRQMALEINEKDLVTECDKLLGKCKKANLSWMKLLVE